MSEKYKPPPEHSLNHEEKEFLNSLSLRELALHNMAIKMLGSSYFVWKSHAFNKWKESNKTNKK